MIPYIQKGNLQALHGKRRKQICGCVKECKHFYTFTTDDKDSDFMLCAGDTKQFSYEILETLGLIDGEREVKRKFETWTVSEEETIINFFKDNLCFDDNGQIRRGILRALATILQKERKKTYNKVKSLMREGKIHEPGAGA